MAPAATPGPTRRLAWFAVAVCVLALAAAAVSFAMGSLIGIVWVLLGGLASNMAWYYLRKSRAAD